MKSKLRVALAWISIVLGGLVTFLSVTVHRSTGVHGYDLAEQIVYIPMSLVLAVLGLMYLSRWYSQARFGLVVWGILGVLVEIADHIAETVLFGGQDSWLDAIIWFAFPVLLLVSFWRRERQ